MSTAASSRAAARRSTAHRFCRAASPPSSSTFPAQNTPRGIGSAFGPTPPSSPISINVMPRKVIAMPRTFIVIPAVLALVLATAHAQQTEQGFRFKSGIELINVTATVSDSSGRFVPGLTQDDFAVFEDDEPVKVTHFSADRVPVSLGIALDTSGSMAGQKLRSAEDALNRFVYDLLDAQDEMFLYRFSNVPMLLQDWTSDRELIARA